MRNTKWVTLTRAYYAFEALELLPRLHAKAFRAFHREDVNLQSESTLFDWVAKQGVERDRFEEVFRSDAVTSRMTDSRALTDSFEIDSTPERSRGRPLSHQQRDDRRRGRVAWSWWKS